MDYREMAALASEPARVREVARLVLALTAEKASRRTRAFLSELSRYDGAKPLSTRQLELLYSLREDAGRRAEAGGYRAATLIGRAHENRLDLNDEEAEEWLCALRRRGAEAALTRREWLRLLALCRRLDLIGSDQWVPLS